MRPALWLVLAGVLSAGCGDLLGIPSSEVYDGDGGGSGGGGTSMWPGFVPIGGLGNDCTAALALGSAAASAFKQKLTFIPCSTGETGCQELSWDGALTWDPTGTGDDLLVFDVQFVYGAGGQVTRLLVRHRYPVGPGYGPNPYEAVLYDLSTGTPLAAIRNVSVDCFVVPVASPSGLWLAGAPSQSEAVVVAAYQPVPTAAASTPLVLEPISVDTTFLQNRALAFDDRLALSQNDGKIVVANASGGDGSTYGPQERVWLSALLGDRFLTVDTQGDGPRYFTLDRSLQFAAYGANTELSLTSDGVHVAYYQQDSDGGVSLFSVSAFDGTSDATPLATIAPPSASGYSLSTFGSTMGDGDYAVLTYLASGPEPGPITATVVDLDTRVVGAGPVLTVSTADSQLPGYRQLVGYAQGSLWFAETGNSGGVSKILRFAAPGG